MLISRGQFCPLTGFENEMHRTVLRDSMTSVP